jgi:hypothetical protein
VFFEAMILDQNANIIPGSHTYIIGAQGPVCGWTPVTVNLGQYIGQQVSLQFTNADCSQGGHFSVSLVDVLCGQLSTSIASIEDSYFTFLFPNPSYGKCVLKTSEINSQLVITNFLGEKIFETKIISEETKINLENFNDGIYFLKLKTKNGVISRKLVKK